MLCRICWPYRAEQPQNAVHLDHNADIAYELFEIRTGDHSEKEIARLGKAPTGTLDAVRAEARDVLDKAFGEDGKRKRENTMKMREAVLNAWNEDGTSKRDVEKLMDAIHA